MATKERGTGEGRTKTRPRSGPTRVELLWQVVISWMLRVSSFKVTAGSYDVTSTRPLSEQTTTTTTLRNGNDPPLLHVFSIQYSLVLLHGIVRVILVRVLRLSDLHCEVVLLQFDSHRQCHVVSRREGEAHLVCSEEGVADEVQLQVVSSLGESKVELDRKSLLHCDLFDREQSATH